MTKIKELIKNSKFIKAEGFDALEPELSIFLPTYKRGDNGLFERALKSILEQNFKNFELIIIDDASVDSTASIYKKYMEKDSRIAVIRHEKNLGLSAVSAIEGYLKSRAQKIFFACDDNDFTKGGIFALMKDQKEHPNHLVSYGQVKLFLNKDDYIILGEEKFAYNDFLSSNKIGHSTVLTDRRIFDEVGYYDPHFALMRVWDWDMWLRAAKIFSFYKVDALITSEYGITQSDSLGNTVGYDMVMTNIWLQRYRNADLTKDKIEDYEFDALPPYTGNYFRIALTEIIKNRFGDKYPLTPICDDEGYILFVAGAYTVSVSVAFDVFSDRIVFANFEKFKENFYKYITDARVVIFCRDIPDYDILNKLKSVGKDYYYFTDDNLFIIPEFAATHCTPFAKEFLSGARGFIATTPCLADELSHKYNKEVSMMTCIRPQYLWDVYKQDLSKYDNYGNIIRIGWCSSGKEDGLIAMKEDLIALAQRQNKKLEFFCFSTSESEKKLKKAFADVSEIKFMFNGLDFCYTHLLNKMREFNPHFLIHTHGTTWSYIYKYKTYNYFITAWYVNAVPLITLRPPYDLLQDDKNVGELIKKEGADTVNCIEKYLTTDKAEIENVLEHIDTFLNETYPIENNQKVLMELFHNNKNVSLQKIFETASCSGCIPSEKNQLEAFEANIAQTIQTKHNFKHLKKVLSKTFTYYVKGKPYKYRYPVRYNFKNVLKEFKATFRYYGNKFSAKKGGCQ